MQIAMFENRRAVVLTCDIQASRSFSYFGSGGIAIVVRIAALDRGEGGKNDGFVGCAFGKLFLRFKPAPGKNRPPLEDLTGCTTNT